MFTLLTFLLLAGVFAAQPDDSATASTQDPQRNPAARHIQQTGSIVLNAPIEKVFPLFGPVREAEWASGWAPEMLYSPTPEGGEGAVFRTTRNHSAPDGTEMLWTIAHLQPIAAGEREAVRMRQAAAISYVTVIPGQRLGRIDIRCHAEGKRTACDVTYSYVQLGAPTEDLMPHFTADYYRHMLDHWQSAINHYLETGKRFE